MVGCKNCFLFDADKLNSKVGYFNTQRDMLVFLLNVVMNIKVHGLKFCKCNRVICEPCQIANIFKEEITFKLYENCFNLDLLNKVKENLHIHLINLLEKKDHFLCKIINDKYYYVHRCYFTGKTITKDVYSAVLEWESSQIKEIKNNNSRVTVENIFKKERLIFCI